MGLYIPPAEIQGKVKKKRNGEMNAPETQLVASGRLASASEADTAQHLAGQLATPPHPAQPCLRLSL